MCSPSSHPAPVAPVAEPIAAPTYADADVQKAGENTRRQQAAVADANVKTSANGITEKAVTKKKTLLGE